MGYSYRFRCPKKSDTKVGALVDFDLKLLPGLAEVQIDPDASKLMGEYSLEHKLLLIWNKSENFRVLTGYKFVMGEYPYGSDMRLLPYIPMAETLGTNHRISVGPEKTIACPFYTKD